MLETGNDIKVTGKQTDKIQLLDKAFSVRSSIDFHLYIYFDHTHLCCTALHPGKKTFQTLHDFKFEPQPNVFLLSEKINTLFKEENILQLNYNGVTVASGDERFTLVPNEHFKEQAARKLLAFNHSLEDDDQILFDDVAELEAKRIYVIPESIHKVLNENLEAPDIYHSATPLSATIAKQNEYLGGDQIYAHIQDEMVEIFLYNGSKLLFDNRFRYRTAADLNYFILFAYDRLSLNPSKIPLTLLGNISKSDEAYDELVRFVQNIRFGDCPDTYRYSPSIKEVDLLPYYNLFSIPECES